MKTNNTLEKRKAIKKN